MVIFLIFDILINYRRQEVSIVDPCIYILLPIFSIRAYIKLGELDMPSKYYDLHFKLLITIF